MFSWSTPGRRSRDRLEPELRQKRRPRPLDVAESSPRDSLPHTRHCETSDTSRPVGVKSHGTGTSRFSSSIQLRTIWISGAVTLPCGLTGTIESSCFPSRVTS